MVIYCILTGLAVYYIDVYKRQAFSIAASRLLSVCSGFGLVCFSNSSTLEIGRLSPS